LRRFSASVALGLGVLGVLVGLVGLVVLGVWSVVGGAAVSKRAAAVAITAHLGEVLRTRSGVANWCAVKATGARKSSGCGEPRVDDLSGPFAGGGAAT